jgi:hypothetical protein
MNPNQTIPRNGSPVPILMIIGVAIAVASCLFSSKDTETQPENAPADAGTENNGKSAVDPAVHGSIPSNSVLSDPWNSTSFFVPSIQRAAQSPQQPQSEKRNRIMRKHMEITFQHGARAMTRMEAVEVLKNLGFSQSAAYEVLSANGRFSAWLRFAPDGMITWMDC